MSLAKDILARFFHFITIYNKICLVKTLNVKYPFVDDASSNRYLGMNFITKDQVSSKLTYLLLTQKGERYYNDQFGTNLLKYIFEPNDLITHAEIIEDIKQDVKNFMPEVTISNIQFLNAVGDNNSVIPNQITVLINFMYNEDSYSDSGLLEFNF